MNETIVKGFGIDNIHEAVFRYHGQDVHVVGVVKDFHQKSLHNNIQPFVFYYKPNLKYGAIILKLKSGNFDNIHQNSDQCH